MIKILVIDDHKDVTYSVKVSLEAIDKAYQVFCANTGKEGLDLVNKTKPDIILLDIMLPDISGWIIATRLKANKKTKNIPIIYLTALSDKKFKKMGLILGEDYIVKPFNGEKLDKAIKTCLKK